MVPILVGCSDDESTPALAPTLDSALIGAWYYSDNSNVFGLEFSEPTNYQVYLFTLVTSTSYCEFYAAGTATTSNSTITYKRTNGQVTNTACLNLLAGGGSNDEPDYYAVSSSGASLALGTGNSQLILAATSSIDWAALPVFDTIPYLTGEGADALSGLSNLGRLLMSRQ